MYFNSPFSAGVSAGTLHLVTAKLGLAGSIVGLASLGVAVRVSIERKPGYANLIHQFLLLDEYRVRSTSRPWVPTHYDTRP